MRYREKAENGALSVAALVFAILSLLSVFFFVSSVPAAFLGILFACLSRGGKKMSGMAVAAVIISAAAIFIALVIVGAMLYTLLGQMTAFYGTDGLGRVFELFIRMH